MANELCSGVEVPPAAGILSGYDIVVDADTDVTAFSACVHVAVLLSVSVFTPAELYPLVGIHVPTVFLVTVPDVRAAPIVVPRDVAVRTPVLLFTAVNPLTTEPSV